MLVNTTLIMWMNLSPYPNFSKAEKDKIPIKSIKDFLFSLSDTLIMSRVVERVCKVVLFY